MARLVSEAVEKAMLEVAMKPSPYTSLLTTGARAALSRWNDGAWSFGTIVRPVRGDNRRMLVLRDRPEDELFDALVIDDDRGGVMGGFGGAGLPPAVGHVGQSFPRRLWEPDD